MIRIYILLIQLFFLSISSFVFCQSKVDTIFLPNAYITVSKPSAKNGDSIIIKAELLTPQDKDVILSFKTFGDAIENQHYITDFKNKGQHTVIGWTADHPNLSSDIFPSRIFVDDKRNLYVCSLNGSSGTVFKWSFGDTLTSTIGQGFIETPYGVVADKLGNVFISDAYQNAVLKFKPGNSMPETVAGGNGTGSLPNQLWYQWGIFIDDSTNLFIADYFNHRIQKWQNNSIIGNTLVGGDIPGTRDKLLPYPKNIYVDKKGFMYVLDAHSFKKWRQGTLQPQTIFEDIRPWYITARGLFVKDNGDILLADGRIYLLDSLGKRKELVNGFDGKPLDIKEPLDIFEDFLGNHFISDYYNFRVVMNQKSPDIIIPPGQKSGSFKIKISDIDSNSSSKVISIKPVYAKNLEIDTSAIESINIKIECVTSVPSVSDIKLCRGQKSINLGVSPISNHDLIWYNSLDVNDTMKLSPPSINTDSASVKTFYVSQLNKVTGCESGRSSFSVSISKDSVPNPPSVIDIKLCRGEKIVNLGVSLNSNHDLIWYNSLDVNDTIKLSPPSINSDSASVKTFYVSQLNKVTGCESLKNKFSVVVLSKPNSPKVADRFLCFGNLTNELKTEVLPGNKLIWYQSETDSIGTYTNPKPIANQIGQKSYYVSQIDTISGCISERSKISVNTVANPTAPKVKDINLCFGSKAEPLKAIADSGHVLIWYDFLPMSPPSFLPLVPRTNVLGKSFVTVLQKDTITGCESIRSTLNINISPLPTSPSVQDTRFCNGDTVFKFNVMPEVGGRIKWYLENGDTLTTPKASELASGKFKYFVSQIDTFGCESVKNEMLVDVLKRPPMPSVDSARYCLNGQSKALIATAGINSELSWYGTNAIGGEKSTIPPIPSTQKEGVFNYFVSQLDTLSKCESERSNLTVVVLSKPNSPKVADRFLCFGNFPNELKTEVLPGNKLIWYQSETDSIGTYTNPKPVSNLIGQKLYYVSQIDTISGCISERSKISVNTVANPTAPKVKDINLCFGSKADPLKAIADSGHVLIWYDFLPMSPPSFLPLVPRTNVLGKSFVSVLQKDTITGCESIRSTLNINISPLPNSPSVQAARFCNGDTVFKFSVMPEFGGRIKWYLENGDTLTTPKASVLAPGKYKYFLSQVDSFGCESLKKEMLIDVIQTPQKPSVDSVEYCLNAQAKALNATASNNSILNWYGTNAIGGVKSSVPTIPSTEKVGIYNYYVTQVDTLTKCESDRNKILVRVNPIPDKPSIVRSSNFLNSNAPLGNQWFKNGELIAGANDTTYKPIENGQYAVKVNLRNCISAISDSYYFITTGLNELGGGGLINVSPNPTSAKLFVESKDTQLSLLTLELFDYSGKLLIRKPRFKMNSFLDISQFKVGSYFLVIKNNMSNIIYQTRIIKSQ